MHTPYQDPHWQEELDKIAPPGGRLSWLRISFWHGYEWEPVGRWMIDQVIPSASIAPSVRQLLEGPNPADHGHFEHDDYGVRRWVTDLPGVSRRQWHFYRETGHYLRPYWVVQGKSGGHRYQFTHAERSIIRLHGGNPEPPYPGQLCYAEPDSRTFAEIGKRDMLKNMIYMVDYLENSRKRLEDYERRGLEEMRKAVWSSLSDQIGAYSNELAFHLRGDFDNAPVLDVNYDKKTEELEHSFITEGA